VRHERKNTASPGHRRDFVIFTDLDGTLLDHDTYDWQPAAEALALCRRLGIPVVMVSSKTRAEMEPLREALLLRWPFVSENGGGIFFPPGCPRRPPAEAVPAGNRGHVWHLGVRYDTVIRALREMREELGRPDLRGFSDMDVEEIAHRTGLSLKDAERAARREYDEPFIAGSDQGADMEQLVRSARRRGLQVTAGGRFFHLFGSCDKGEAVSRLFRWFSPDRPGLRSVGLGDGPNDISMLQRVDVPVLVRSSSRTAEPAGNLPGLRVTGERGPAGWNRAILDLLENFVDRERGGSQG
jgi:mannosyl-3-phosphoglycerate phosphatase